MIDLAYIAWKAELTWLYTEMV